jgi:hypothetical protein
MRRQATPSGERASQERTRDWERTAALALLVAAGAGVLGATSNPHWEVGDLLVGVYFAAVSLMLWGQSARIRLNRAAAPFTRPVITALGIALGVGVFLMVVDLATHGAIWPRLVSNDGLLAVAVRW